MDTPGIGIVHEGLLVKLGGVVDVVLTIVVVVVEGGFGVVVVVETVFGVVVVVVVNEEDPDGGGGHQLLRGSLLVRDGGEGANDESKQGSVRRHNSNLL